jgi:hypothetical protein
MNKFVAIHSSFLQEELFMECQKQSCSFFNEKKLLQTNHDCWHSNIIKDSNVVYIYRLLENDPLYTKIRETIQIKLNIDKIKCIIFYYWSQNSHIPWHNDNTHIGGITIYLNEIWDKDSGGLFLFENDEIIQGIYPERNMCIQQQGNVNHSVSPTTSQSEIRSTIQIFY